MDKEAYIEKTVGWLMPKGDDPIAGEVGASLALDGIYSGDSERIARIVRIAYLRGVRRGAAAAWNANQPVTIRGERAEGQICAFCGKLAPPAQEGWTPG